MPTWLPRSALRCATHPGVAHTSLALVVSLSLIAAGGARLAHAEPATEGGDHEAIEALALRAKGLAALDDCPKALDVLAVVRSHRPDDAALARLEGECRIREGDYAGAERVLRTALRRSPQLEDARLYLAIALYHLESFDAAEASLQRAANTTSDFSQAQWDLYRGLLLLRRAQLRDAALALERARLTDAAQVEPVASYYAGLAWLTINERRLARDALERVIALDRQEGQRGPWARRAELALQAREAEDPLWLTITTGLEYDDNVILLADGVPLATGVGGQADGRGVWLVEGGAELYLGRSVSGGVLGSYEGSAHFDLRSFDVHHPTAALWLDYDLDTRTIVRARYDVGHAWVGYSPFLTHHAVSLATHRSWGAAGQTELFLTWLGNDFLVGIVAEPRNTVPGPPGSVCVPDLGAPCTPSTVDAARARDRSGDGLRVGVSHSHEPRFALPHLFEKIALRASYSFERYWARGRDHDAMAHVLSVGGNARVPFDARFDFDFAFAERPHDNPSSYPDPADVTLPAPGDPNVQLPLSSTPRRDRSFWLNLSLTRPLASRLEMSLRWQFIDNHSNVVVFDYDRWIFGTYLTLGL